MTADEVKAAFDGIRHALHCDLDCSWRVLEAVRCCDDG